MLKGLSYKVPKWLVEAIGLEWDKDLIPRLDKDAGFDHVRTYKSRVVISQPYEADGSIGETLAKLQKRGIRIRVWGTSPYYPGNTFSIVLWRPQDDSFAHEVMELMAAGRPGAPDKKAHLRWS
jgi:hypothetical protein